MTAGTSDFVWSQSAGTDILPYRYLDGAHPAINDNGLVMGDVTGNGSVFAL